MASAEGAVAAAAAAAAAAVSDIQTSEDIGMGLREIGDRLLGIYSGRRGPPRTAERLNSVPDGGAVQEEVPRLDNFPPEMMFFSLFPLLASIPNFLCATSHHIYIVINFTPSCISYMPLKVFDVPSLVIHSLERFN